MVLFEWEEKYSVGIKEIDDQHMKLIGMINELHEYMIEGEGRKQLGETLRGLSEYADTHFQTEEYNMRIYSYERYDSHKSEHDMFRRRVKDYLRKHDSGELFLTVEVNHFMTEWLKNHILGTDKGYAPLLKNKGLI